MAWEKAKFLAAEKSSSQGKSNTLAPRSSPTCRVRSPLPVSARITSSTRSPTDARHRGRVSSSSFTIMHKLTVINALSPFM